jgi:hypothetical protein
VFTRALPLVPILSQIDPVHTIPRYLSKIHFIIDHPPTSWSSQWSLFFRLSHQYPTCILVLLHSCFMPCQSHLHWQVMKLLIMQFPLISRHFISLRTKYSPQHHVLSLMSQTKIRTHIEPEAKSYNYLTFRILKKK